MHARLRIQRFLQALPLAFLLACGSKAAPPRSVLLITVDTLRADHLGCFGDADAKTPNIDALAARGVKFASAFSAVPLTLPSHTTILTGTIPPHHGVRDNATYRVVPEVLTLTEILRERGFRTAAFVAAYVLDSQYGLNQGFEVYGDVPQRTMVPRGVEDRQASEVNAEAFHWLEGLRREEPFFLWVHYYEPHLPYPDARLMAPAFRSRPYDGEIASADTAVGGLLNRLKSLGRDEETLVVFTSDHGESLGEHGELSHGFFTYQSVLRVPLILAHDSLPRGASLTENVSLVDVMPTVLELLQLPIPELPPPARSLAGLTRGGKLEERALYFECLNPYLNYGWAPLQGVVVGRQKYIRAPRAELYDLGSDPGEMHDLRGTTPEVAARLEGELGKLIEVNERKAPRGQARRDLSPAERERLAGLGYTGTAAPHEGEKTLADPKDKIARNQKEEQLFVLVSSGHAQEGFDLVRELLREDPDNAVFNGRLGAMLMLQEKYADAIPYLRRSLDHGYRVADSIANLGICQFLVGQTDEAQKTLAQALEVDAKNLAALLWMARTNLAKGDKPEARARLETLLSLWKGGADPMADEARTMLKSLDG